MFTKKASLKGMFCTIICVCSSFFAMATDASDDIPAQSILNFISEYSPTDKSSITDDGKYMCSDAYNFLKGNLCDSFKYNITEDEDDTKRMNQLKKYFSVASEYGNNITVIDVSYNKLKKYYDDIKNDIAFKEPQSPQEAENYNSSIKELKQFFDGNDDKNPDRVWEMAKKYLFGTFQCEIDFKGVDSSKQNNDERFKNDVDERFKKYIFDVLETIVATNAGLKRINSFLLLQLLACIKSAGNREIMEFRTLSASSNYAPYENKIHIIARNTGYTSAVNSPDIVDFDIQTVAENRFCFGYSEESKPREGVDILKKVDDAILNMLQSGCSVDENLLKIAKNMHAFTIFHEIGHTYHMMLLPSRVFYTLGHDGGLLKDTQLIKSISPIANKAIRDKVKLLCNGNDNIKTYLNNPSRTWCHTVEDLIARESARIASDIGGLSMGCESLVMNGINSLGRSAEHFLFIDYHNENAIRYELKEPLVYGHYRFKYGCDVNSEGGPVLEKAIKDNYPFPVHITTEGDINKVFEPNVLEQVLTQAIWDTLKEGDIKQLELFKYVIDPEAGK
ncbi:MAG: hypothetical protein LBB21_02635 [Holosporaceae bacterium]|nr:hypothetical protein [Holosporaceae bacterium]